jgi:hypothetical protein
VAGDGMHAHHIVPKLHGGAAEARKLLERYQIDLEGLSNGVALAPEIHRRLHSPEAIEAVTRRLRDAVRGVDDWSTGRKALLDELAAIRNAILNGPFP